MATTREASPLVATNVGVSEALYDKLSPGPGRPAAEVAAHQRARVHSAMVEIVAQRGYNAVTVRELARLAGVSTRAFYKHFGGKEDCFLRTYELVVRRAAKRIVASQAGERDWRERLRLAFNAFARELEREPHAARLALLEAYAAGPAALEQIRRTERMFEAMIAESFARAPDGIAMPPLVIEGMVAGVAHVARVGMQAEQWGERDLGGGLLEWTLCYRSESAVELADRDRRCMREGCEAGLPHVPSSADENGAGSPADDHALILSAVTKLVVAEGYGQLTAPRIRAAAGVSRRSFDSHFAGVEDCFLRAVELRAREAIAHAARDKMAAHTWAGGVHRAIVSLCAQVARDSVLAGLCFVDLLAAGSEEGMRCRERLQASILNLICNAVPPDQRPTQLAAEASAGAIWGVLQHHVMAGRARQLPQMAAPLSFLALAPIVGAPAAAEAICSEQAAQ